MAPEELPPYPVGDDRAGPPAPTAERTQTDGRWRRAIAPRLRRAGAIASLLALGLLAVAFWLQAQSARNDADAAGELLSAAERELSALQRDRTVAESALAAALAQPGVDPGDLDSAPMVAMGAAAQQLRSRSTPGVPELYEAVFDARLTTTAWTRLGPADPSGTVLAKVDDADRPTTLWVSSRDRSTADPGVPNRDPCLAVDVARLLASASLPRSGSSDVPGGPLRWWPDVYRFVPAAECGTGTN